jgi:hypothetical protein
MLIVTPFFVPVRENWSSYSRLISPPMTRLLDRRISALSAISCGLANAFMGYLLRRCSPLPRRSHLSRRSSVVIRRSDLRCAATAPSVSSGSGALVTGLGGGGAAFGSGSRASDSCCPTHLIWPWGHLEQRLGLRRVLHQGVGDGGAVLALLERGVRVRGDSRWRVRHHRVVVGRFRRRTPLTLSRTRSSRCGCCLGGGAPPGSSRE